MSQGTHLVLDIEGMTCASCVARVEKGLNQLPGVHASVNLVTNTAIVDAPESIDPLSLISAVRGAGYNASISVAASTKRPALGTTSLPWRLWVSVALTIPTILLAMVPAWQFNGWQWVSFALATPVVVWSAFPIHRATVAALRHGTATMDTLITLGTATAYLWSVYALFFGMAGHIGMTHTFELFAWNQNPTGNIYFETASGVTTFILLGRWLEDRSKRRAASALAEVGRLTPTTATVLRDGIESLVAMDLVRVGDIVVVRPGEVLPVDGVIERGSSSLNVSALTGESLPVDTAVGDEVAAGTTVLDGRLEIRVLRSLGDTRIAQLARLVERAQLRKMSIQRVADRISSIFVPIVLGLSVLTFAGWLVAGFSAESGVTAAVAVLVIACPCALGLATPVALIVGMGRAAHHGIVLSGPDVVEQSPHIDTVFLDKTGTLTTGEMSLVRTEVAIGESAEEVLARAASVEAGSQHPLARAIVTAHRETRHGTPSEVATTKPTDDYHSVAGGGAQARVEGELVAVGKTDWLESRGIRVPSELRARVSSTPGRHADADTDFAMTTVGVAWGGLVRGLVMFSDSVRADSLDAVGRLRDMGCDVVLITGDAPGPAEVMAKAAGISEVHSRATPERKIELVELAQRDGHQVAMVGDGINDAAALAQADIGLAMGTGTQMAIAASDVTLVRSNLTAAVDALALARRTMSTIRGNLFWAFAYNVVMIPLAMVGLLTPMLAGAAMAFSSLFVVLNSLRLRRITL